MGNGWFRYVVMPLVICASSWCLRNPASAWGMVGFDERVLVERASSWGMPGFEML